MKTRALIWAIECALPIVAIAAQYTLTVPDGEYRLIPVCRFQGVQNPDISIGPPPQQELFQYNPMVGGFWISDWLFGAWGPTEPPYPAGEGAIFQPSGGGATLLFQQRNVPKLPLILAPGLNLVGCQSDTIASFEDIVGAPPANGTLLYQFNAGPGRNPFNLAAPDYTIFTFANGGWSPTNPVIGITEAVFVYQPPQLSNAEVTANGISFEILPPINQQFVIEYTDSLTQPSWQPLTNVVGSGASIEISDSLIGSGVKQRFYRARSTR
jgi:hypothetical protein